MTAKAAQQPMKVEVSRKDMVRELAFISTAAARKATMPILQNVLIEAKNQRIGLTTTDLDLRLQSEIEASVTDPGALNVPCRTLLTILRAGATDNVTLAVNGIRLEIGCGSSRWAIDGVAASDFPTIEDEKRSELLRLNQTQFLGLFKPVIHAVTEEVSRYALRAILLQAKEGKLRAVATDGHRLALTETDGNGEYQHLMPANLIKRALECKDEYTLALSEKFIIITSGPRTLTARRQGGNFPDYTKVFPSLFKHQVSVDCLEMISAIGRVSLLADKQSRGVRVEFGQEQVTLACSNLLGEASESIAAEGNAAVKVGVNADYIKQALLGMKGSCKINFNDESSPVLFEANDIRELIMPIRLA